MSSTHADTIRRMINAINEREPARRRSLIEEAFTSDCAYTDPDDEVHGHDALDALFERLQHQAPPELRFSLLGCRPSARNLPKGDELATHTDLEDAVSHLPIDQ